MLGCDPHYSVTLCFCHNHAEANAHIVDQEHLLVAHFAAFLQELKYRLRLRQVVDRITGIGTHPVQIEQAHELLGKAIPMWIRYAELKPQQAWMVIHLLKDGLFALDRYSEIEDILKQILKIDKDNIEVVASLSEILSHRGEDIEAMELIESAMEQDPTSLIVKLIKMKHQAKKERSGNEYIRGLDDLIHFLVTDERFQIYKNTDTDPDIIWLYETSAEKESIVS